VLQRERIFEMTDQVDMTLMARRLRLDMARRLEETLTKPSTA
jgi:hypothetical protein